MAKTSIFFIIHTLALVIKDSTEKGGTIQLGGVKVVQLITVLCSFESFASYSIINFQLPRLILKSLEAHSMGQQKKIESATELIAYC